MSCHIYCLWLVFSCCVLSITIELSLGRYSDFTKQGCFCLSKFVCLSSSMKLDPGLKPTLCWWETSELTVRHWVHLFSLPGSTRLPRIALTGLTRVSPQCPACGVGHLGVTRVASRHHERASVIVWLSLVRGSPEWALWGRPREAYRMHPLLTAWPWHAMIVQM